MNCKEFSKHIGDYVNRTLDEGIARGAEVHLSTCTRCASLVKELENTSLAVSLLERANAPVGFEVRLKTRLVAQGASKESFVRRWIGGHQLALRPVLAGLILCAIIVGSVFIFGQGHKSDAPAMDWGYIEICQTQHASFAAANPLADDSAVILKERARELNNDL